jgi:hypothetical protein
VAVGLDVLAGAEVRVGAAVVDLRVGEEPIVGTVWYGGAPQDWLYGSNKPNARVTSITSASLSFAFVSIFICIQT